MRRGDICIAAARGTYTGKPRPVVIVQDDRFDATASITVCPLTTNPLDAPLTRIDVEVTAATGIEQPSKIMRLFRLKRATCFSRLRPAGIGGYSSTVYGGVG